MGHACSILTFSCSESKRDIQAECDEWARCNADLQENSWPSIHIHWNESKVFDTYEQARAYLEGTFGDYSCIAVRYKKAKPVAKCQDLERRIQEYHARCMKLQEPQYVPGKVSIQTIKCKRGCGAVLPVAYGHRFRNRCPVCGADLRSDTILAQEAKYRATIEELTMKRDQLMSEAMSKVAVKPSQLNWAIACEVHC